jgi:hypothetical protein
MFESDILVYTALGVSLSASAIQICQWLLNANPRAVLNAGQWSVAGLIGLMPALLLWLVMSGRSTLALVLAAFILPVLTWGAPRWRALFGSLSSPRGNFPRGDHDFSAPIVPGSPVQPDPINPDLVRQSVAVLTAYLEQAAGQGWSKPTRIRSADRLLNGPDDGSGRRRMSIEEALAVLGLEATAGPHQISEARDRLWQKLDSELGDTHYLIMKIDEARDILLLEEGRGVPKRD